MPRSTREDIARDVAQSLGITLADSDRVIRETLSVISNHLTDGKSIELRGFGVFSVVARKARFGRNPRVKGGDEAFEIPAHNEVKFKSGESLRARVIATPIVASQ